MKIRYHLALGLFLALTAQISSLAWLTVQDADAEILSKVQLDGGIYRQ